MDTFPKRRPLPRPQAGHGWRQVPGETALLLSVLLHDGFLSSKHSEQREGQCSDTAAAPAMWGGQHGNGAGVRRSRAPPPLGWRWPRCWQEPGCARRQGAGRPRPAGSRSKEQRGTESLPSAVLISSFQRLTLPRLTPPSVHTPSALGVQMKVESLEVRLSDIVTLLVRGPFRKAAGRWGRKPCNPQDPAFDICHRKSPNSLGSNTSLLPALPRRGEGQGNRDCRRVWSVSPVVGLRPAGAALERLPKGPASQLPGEGGEQTDL